MITSRGSVPHFSLKPNPLIMGLLAFVLIIGLLTALSFYAKEDGTEVHARKGHVVLIITGLVSFCLFIVATSKMWFSHLWKKNSTHARHKQHSEHHPVNRHTPRKRHR